ncbi:hypothetical protein GUITHDRAFT_75827, partial [Guillardia theta CCMP2712]
QEGWPDVIAKEIQEELQRFMSATYITIGNIAGNTYLPLPYFGTEDIEIKEEISGYNDKERIHVIENSIVLWTKQIKDVLLLNPEVNVRNNGLNATEVELEFWSKQAKKLNSISHQLESSRFDKIMQILEISKSTFFPAFSRLCKEVKTAQEEANDNVLYLRPANKIYSAIMVFFFILLLQRFNVIMHVTLLVWKHSKFYNTQGRLVLLIREICNEIIIRSRRQGIHLIDNNTRYMGNEIWTSEPEHAIGMVYDVIESCENFKQVYQKFKERSIAECPDNPWRFQNDVLFEKLDNFLERCNDVLNLMTNLNDFKTLKYLEIGGSKGKTLTSSVYQINSDFEICVLNFQNANIDIFDAESRLFDESYFAFKIRVDELERRLASVIVQAFEDCSTIIGKLKLLQSFGNLLHRDVLQAELQSKHTQLFREYLQDIQQVIEIFNSGKSLSRFHYNSPPHAGAVMWSRGLLERIQEPMLKFRQIYSKQFNRSEGQDIQNLYSTTSHQLRAFEDEHISQWSENILNISEEKLKMPLLKRISGKDMNLLSVNFDPALVCLLREVRYFVSLAISVPEAARTLFLNEEKFRIQSGNLDLIVVRYNKILQMLSQVEKRLIQTRIDAIDKILENGLTNINWKSHSIDEFITQAMSMVGEAYHIAESMKHYMSYTQDILQSWIDNPMIQRKTMKTYLPTDFSKLQSSVIEQGYAHIRNGGRTIHDYLVKFQNMVGANKGSASFKAYLQSVDQIVVEGLRRAFLASLTYLYHQIDSDNLIRSDTNPLLEIQLLLENNQFVFQPTISSTDDKKGLRDMIFSWIHSFQNIGTLVPRVDNNVGFDDYDVELHDDTFLRKILKQIDTSLAASEAECDEFRLSFNEFSFLWMSSPSNALESFLEYEREIIDSVPSVSSFEREIFKYRQIEEEIRFLPGSQVVGWLKIDTRPLRQTLLNLIASWRSVFQEYPLNFVEKSVSEMLQFISDTSKNLDLDVFEFNSLVNVLKSLRDIKLVEAKFTMRLNMMLPMLQMLSKHGRNIPFELIQEAEGLKMKWIELKNKGGLVKDKNSDLIRKESSSLQTKIKEMTKKVERFRSYFLHQLPNSFQDDSSTAFAQLDALISAPKNSIQVYQKERERLLLLQELFEVEIQDFPSLLECLRDAQVVKTLLDINSLLVNTLKHWKKQRWYDVLPKMMEVDMMEIDSILENLNPEVKRWNLYIEMHNLLAELKITIPILESLQSENIKTRHWKQIMRATGVSFVIDNKFVLEELLKLNLHLFKDEISRIIVQSSQEHGIEKQLRRIEDYFNQLKMQGSDSSQTFNLNLDPEIYSDLEQNLNVLHTLASSKYVSFNQYLQEAIHSLLDKLGFVERFSEYWNTVITKWQSLEGVYSKFKLKEDFDEYYHVASEWKKYVADLPQDFTSLHSAKEITLQALWGFVNNFEKFEKNLEALLKYRRKIHPILYFLSDKDLIKLLTLDTRIQSLDVYVNMLSQGIHGLSIRKENNHNFQVRGIVNNAGETLAFPEAILLSQENDVNVSNVMEHTKKVMENRIYSMYVECKQKERWKTFQSMSTQEILHIFSIFFTEKVTNALEQCEKPDSTGDILEILSSNLKADHQETVDLNAQTLSHIERKKYASLVVAGLAQLDIMGTLVKCSASSRSSFEWQSQKRMYMNFETCKSHGEILNYKREYGHEVLGHTERIVLTPMTQRCQISMANAAGLRQIGALLGRCGNGKRSILQDMASFFGEAIRSQVFFEDCKDIVDLVHALSITNSWAVFEVSMLKSVDAAVLYSAIKETLLFLRRNINVNRGEADTILRSASSSPTFSVQPQFFLTIDVDALNYLWHPSIKGDLRACTVFEVHLEIVLSTKLQSEGFQKHVMLTHRLCSLKEIIENLVLTRVSVSLLKALIWKAKTIISAGLLQDEISAFVIAVEELLSQRFDLQEHTNAQIISQVFGELSLETSPTDKTWVYRDFRAKTICFEQAAQEHRSIFVIGPANSGKSSIIHSYIESKVQAGKKVKHLCMNPKAIQTAHMVGYYRDGIWMDGVLTCALKDLEQDAVHDMKILIFDSLMDPVWTEMIKPLIDTKRFFQSKNQENIAINPDTKVFFETPDLQLCAPCIVGTSYISFVGDDCVPWKALIESWVSETPHKEILREFSEFYLPKIVNFLEENEDMITGYHLKSRIKGLIEIFDLIAQINVEKLDREEQTLEKAKSLEGVYIFSCFWALFGCFDCESATNFRKKANSFWKETFDRVILPSDLTIFEICFDFVKREFVPWQSQLSVYFDISQSNFGQLFVPTPETVPYSFLTSMLASWNKFVLLKGRPGCGKSSLIRETLRVLDQEVFSTEYMLFQCTTSAETLQQKFQGMLVRSTKRFWYPLSGKKLIIQVDDMNLCERDRYDSQNACEFLRYFLKHRQYYEGLSSISVNVKDVVVVGSYTPFPGFALSQRLENKFISFTIDNPSDNALHTIVTTLALTHFNTFETRIKSFISEAMVWATINVHHMVNECFKAVGERFHYVYGLKDICAVMQGMSRATTRFFDSPASLISLWIHECERVYSDRFVSKSDFQIFKKKLNDACFKWFDEYDDDINMIVSKNNLYAPLVLQGLEPGSELDQTMYSVMLNMDKAKRVVAEKHLEFQRSAKLAPFVTLTHSLSHITRLTRAMTQPSGHVIFLGSHGSERRVLIAISAYILGIELVSGKGSYDDFWKACKRWHKEAGLHSKQVVVVLEDDDLLDCKKVSLTQEIIATGYASSFFDRQQKEDLCKQVKPRLNDSGIIDNADNCWEYYLTEARKNFHFSLCFANDSEFRKVSVSRFPSLYQGIVIDFYHPLVKENLIEMAQMYLKSDLLVPEYLKDNSAQHLAFVFDFFRFSSISSTMYLDKSPSGFLNYVSEFQALLRRKHVESQRRKVRIQSVLHKLQTATEKAKFLEQRLQDDLRDLQDKSDIAEQSLQSLSHETSIVDAEKASASEEEAVLVSCTSEFERQQQQYLEEHKSVDPFVTELESSLSLIDKKSLNELKALNTPPNGVEDVILAVAVIVNKGTVPKEVGWNFCKKVIANSEQLLKALNSINGENVSDAAVAYCEANLVKKDSFNPDKIRSKSAAASGMCAWVISLCRYHKAFQAVMPARKKLDEAAGNMQRLEVRMANVHSHLQAMDEKLSHLTSLYQAALAEKNKAQGVVNDTRSQIDVAKKMMDILSVQSDRWTMNIKRIESDDQFIFGDTLLCASYLSFMGVCNRVQRKEILSSWKLDLTERDIAVSKEFSITRNLLSEVEIDRCHLWKLPQDSLVLENAALVLHSLQTPVILDPDDVFLRWLRNHLGLQEQGVAHGQTSEVVWCSCHDKNFVEKIDACITSAKMLVAFDLLDDIPDSLLGYLSKKNNIYLHTRLERPRFISEHCSVLTVIDCKLDSTSFEAILQEVINRELDFDNYKKVLSQKEEQIELLGKRESCEQELLSLIADSSGDVLEDPGFLENLEKFWTRFQAAGEEYERSTLHQEEIRLPAEYYEVSYRGTLLYQLAQRLVHLDSTYMVSTPQLLTSFLRGLRSASDDEAHQNKADPDWKLQSLMLATTLHMCRLVVASLSSTHRLPFLSFVTLEVSAAKDPWASQCKGFLLRKQRAQATESSPFPWLHESQWSQLSDLEDLALPPQSGSSTLVLRPFAGFKQEMLRSSGRFREWYLSDSPEHASLPGDWRQIDETSMIALVSILRPDRLPQALEQLVRKTLGLGSLSTILNSDEAVKEQGDSKHPIFFIVNEDEDVEELVRATLQYAGLMPSGRKMRSIILSDTDMDRLDILLEEELEGDHVVHLQDVQVASRWLNLSFPLFLSRLRQGTLPCILILSGKRAAITEVISGTCLKVDRTAPRSLHSCLKMNVQAVGDKIDLEHSSPTSRKMMFALCVFYAVIDFRKSFREVGWNHRYSFGLDSLLVACEFASDVAEGFAISPWQHLRHMVVRLTCGEEMSDGIDESVLDAYCHKFVSESLLSNLEILPGLKTPGARYEWNDIVGQLQQEEVLHSPTSIGLFKYAGLRQSLEESQILLECIGSLQLEASGSSRSSEEALTIADEILDKIPEVISVESARKDPLSFFFLSEIDRLNRLTSKMTVDVTKWRKGLKQQLLSADESGSVGSMASNMVPTAWEAMAYPSLRSLSSWLADLKERHGQLRDIASSDLEPLKAIWLPGLFCPQAFMHAVRVSLAKTTSMAVEATEIEAAVLSGERAAPGAFDGEAFHVSGIFLEGARWSEQDARLELASEHHTSCSRIADVSLTPRKERSKPSLSLPVYRTRMRGNSYLFHLLFPSNEHSAAWLMSGAAVVLDVETSARSEGGPSVR